MWLEFVSLETNVWIHFQDFDIFNLFRCKTPCSKSHVHTILHNLLFLMKNHIKVTPEAPHPLPFDKRWKLVSPVLDIYWCWFPGPRNGRKSWLHSNFWAVVAKLVLKPLGFALGFLYISIKLWWALHALASQNAWYFLFFLVVSWLF